MATFNISDSLLELMENVVDINHPPEISGTNIFSYFHCHQMKYIASALID